MKYNEVLRQEYSENVCIFSAGFVEGHPIDTMYIRLEREGDEPTTILLRPDEMASIAWLAAGVLWSKEMEILTKHTEDLPKANAKQVRCPTCGHFLNVVYDPSVKP